MTSGTESAGVTAITFAAIMAAKPLGVPMETILLGMAFAIIGAFGKLALDLSRYFRGVKGLTLGGIFGSFGASLIGSPFASLVMIAALPHLGIEMDSWGVIGFLAMGYGGPELIFSLYGLASKAVQSRFGITLPSSGGQNVEP